MARIRTTNSTGVKVGREKEKKSKRNARNPVESVLPFLLGSRRKRRRKAKTRESCRIRPTTTIYLCII